MSTPTDTLNREAWNAMQAATRHLRQLSERSHWMAELAHADRRRDDCDAWNRASADASLLPTDVEWTLRETIRRSTDVREIMEEVGRLRITAALALIDGIPAMLPDDGPLARRLAGSAAKARIALITLVESLAALDACHAATAEVQS